MVGLGETWRRVPALQTRTWQNVVIACPVALPWAKAVAAQELCCSCGLPHLHPSASLSAPPTSLSASPSHPLSPLSVAWERTRVGFSPSPLFSYSPRPRHTHTHQAWCHQQYFQKEGSEILFFLFFAHLRHAWN